MGESTELSTTNAADVTLTPAAVQKALSLLAQEGRSDLRLRIAVQPGGCAGLRYNLFFDDRVLDGDIVTKFHAQQRTDDCQEKGHVANVAGGVDE